MVLFGSYASYLRDPRCPWGLTPSALERIVTLAAESWGSGQIVAGIAPSRADDERFREWYGRGERLAASPTYAAERIRARLGVDVRPLLAELHVPTLVLHRRDDLFIRVAAGRYLAENIAGARLVELPGEDNAFFVGNSDALLDK